jgi:hypothetical protein
MVGGCLAYRDLPLLEYSNLQVRKRKLTVNPHDCGFLLGGWVLGRTWRLLDGSSLQLRHCNALHEPGSEEPLVSAWFAFLAYGFCIALYVCFMAAVPVCCSPTHYMHSFLLLLLWLPSASHPSCTGARGHAHWRVCSHQQEHCCCAC